MVSTFQKLNPTGHKCKLIQMFTRTCLPEMKKKQEKRMKKLFSPFAICVLWVSIFFTFIVMQMKCQQQILTANVYN